MNEKTIAIIGAGVSGLAAGCYGRMNGYRTHTLLIASTRGSPLGETGGHTWLKRNVPRCVRGSTVLSRQT